MFSAISSDCHVLFTVTWRECCSSRIFNGSWTILYVHLAPERFHLFFSVAWDENVSLISNFLLRVVNRALPSCDLSHMMAEPDLRDAL